jgi:hypothetical protein
MPNWCECDFCISGPKEEVERFLESVKGEESVFDFNQLACYPEHFSEADGPFRDWLKKPADEREALPPLDGFNRGGYEWCIANWGTKWNANDAKLVHQSTWNNEGRPALSVMLAFSTAWSPPLPIVMKASERFPELEFELRYFERGMEFNGIFVCKGGEVTRNEDGPYFGMRGG